MKILFEIRKKTLHGQFKGSNTLVECTFESVDEAGEYLIQNICSLFGENIGLTNHLAALKDCRNNETIFRVGDTSVRDGYDLFEIIPQTITL